MVEIVSSFVNIKENPSVCHLQEKCKVLDKLFETFNIFILLIEKVIKLLY